MRLLLVEDDLAVRRLITNHLEYEGVTVTVAATLAAAMAELHHGVFDMAILDLTLPDGSGLDLLRALRARLSVAHVTILSGAGSEIDRVGALELGADDYVVKPFFVRELTARVLAVQRRLDLSTANRFRYGSMCIDLVARELVLDGVPVHLTAREFDLLACMAALPRHVFSREDLLRAVWNSAGDLQRDSTVTEHIRRLRGKIERDPLNPRILRTARGAGYRFDPPPVAPSKPNAPVPST